MPWHSPFAPISRWFASPFLAGGTNFAFGSAQTRDLLLQLNTTKDVPKITPDVQNQVELVIDRRVNSLGVSEPVISKAGADRLLVETPAVKDADQLEKLLKEVAVLEFKILPERVSQRARSDPKYAGTVGLKPNQPSQAYLDGGPVVSIHGTVSRSTQMP